MGIYKIEHKRPKDSRFANNVNFLACILLASDWFKDNQLLSQLTHAHYRDTVPLRDLGFTVSKTEDQSGRVLSPCSNQVISNRAGFSFIKASFQESEHDDDSFRF